MTIWFWRKRLAKAASAASWFKADYENSTEERDGQTGCFLRIYAHLVAGCNCIIAILAAMLLPALSKAKDRALGAGCLSNEKRVALAIVLYAGDSSRFLPANIRSSPAGRGPASQRQSRKRQKDISRKPDPRAVQVKLWPNFGTFNIQHSTFNAQHRRNVQIQGPWELNVEC